MLNHSWFRYVRFTDLQSFVNFVRTPVDLFNEIVDKVTTVGKKVSYLLTTPHPNTEDELA